VTAPANTDSRFLLAARRKPVDRTPVWLMRQAGRSLPEYRKLRERWTLVDIVAQPELCAEVTLQPVRRLQVDAAVMFADIMLPLRGMGVDFELVESVGPVIERPIRTPADVDALGEPGGEEAAPQVIESVKRVVAESPVPVICFCGAPFTLASYLIEGRPSRDFSLAKRFMFGEPAAFDRLLGKLAGVMARYLAAQVAAGAGAIQVFDSWVGALGVEDYEERVAPHTRAIFDATASLGVPRVHFGTGTASLLESIAATGPDVVSLDWRVPLDAGWNRVGLAKGVQGNLDPAVLLGPPEFVRQRAGDVLRRAGGRPGHVFNLGHGVLPETPLENLQTLIETVHEGLPELPPPSRGRAGAGGNG
jgi:uroporphyrinogen decarboxylase